MWAHFEATQLVGEEGEEERSGSYDIYTMSTCGTHPAKSKGIDDFRHRRAEQ